MNISVIKTDKIVSGTRKLFDVFDRFVPTLHERSILVVTSKIVSICEGRIIQAGSADKNALIRKEADRYISSQNNPYGIILTIKNNTLIPSAGIDESNGNGYYILWPEDPQKTANTVREYLAGRFSLKKTGVIITDSKTTPLRWGTTGVAIAHSGFQALRSYIGTPDIFGRKLLVTKANIADGLAAAAVTAMGEGNEQTPIAVISDIPDIVFRDRNPTVQELKGLTIHIKEDLYAPLLTSVRWEKKK
jgi:putative folate metabolism gamma-glutamate ligase